ncbi:MAG: DNA-directed RNA polymerase subunit beta [Bacteroidetes bacterium]|nr:DNA-directed RNA polymerase subunit beta [Bacteroidota bacterium]MCL5034043.1 DNA-directed RNA polymerase subunit beta [Bacteroidota bacterium]
MTTLKNVNSNGQDAVRISFAKIPQRVDYPDLLDVQIQSFKKFLQEDAPVKKRKSTGLQGVFQMNFPIYDNKEHFALDFVEYSIEKPRYGVDECIEKGLTYSVTLKAKLRLASKDSDPGKEGFMEAKEQEVYLGSIPYMTDRATFIINGAERVVVSQLHRSPGVFFVETEHPNGARIWSSRVIPMRGAWLEFTTDINNVLWVYIDRKKKFYATTLLRALGYEKDEDILQLFSQVEEVSLAKTDPNTLLGRRVVSDVVDTKTGEIIIDTDGASLEELKITEEHLELLQKANVKKIRLLKATRKGDDPILFNTIRQDSTSSSEGALKKIYEELRSVEAQDTETARGLLEKMFFSEKRYDLGNVGRYRMNAKLTLDIPTTTTVLTKEDIVAIIDYMLKLRRDEGQIDDIDHLGNRRVKTVGEQLESQFNLALTRMVRNVKERMNIHDEENFTPQGLVNARVITTVLNSFFGTSQLSQFMDQTNPLAEMTHKRRMSALGPGGLTRERAGFEVRDVHYTHYGRLCPIETPEGPNIGLISSLAVHGRVNDFGFIETPYFKVVNGIASEEIVFLSAAQEDEYKIAQANTPVDEKGKITTDRVRARFHGDFILEKPSEIQFMDVATNQIVSPAAALIPFLEHDDANRALMGANMQRQAVPLINSESPVVGTGLEKKVAADSRTLVIAEHEGVVQYVDGSRIIVKYDINEKSDEVIASFEDLRTAEYRLRKFFRTNQDTTVNQKPLVKVGQRFKKGEVLADGCSTQDGELALGRNIMVAFMPWHGYNFEDAVIVSEDLVANDAFTSLHIQSLETSVRDTKRGEEELTRDIPNVSEEMTKDLDDNGIIRVGAEIMENDILVGKITPKGETDVTPEEKLLRAIFGDKAGDVKDASLKAPPGMRGVVIDTKLFSRKKKDAESKKEEKKRLEEIEKWLKTAKAEVQDKLIDKLGTVLDDEVSTGIRAKDGSVAIRSGTALKKETFLKFDDLDKLDFTEPWVESARKNKLIEQIYRNYHVRILDLEEEARRERNKAITGDELPPGIVQLAKVYVASKRKLQVGDKMAGRHGNKGVVSIVVPREDMPFLPDGTPVEMVLNPLGVPSRMNIGQLYETALGWAAKRLGVKYASPIFDGATWEEVQGELRKAGLSESSKTVLFDGKSGEKFTNEVTVGCMYMMKLDHLVEDKIHARSTGQYSLITQQPLGGKAQFGGQRFGEMEVWALEAYGASHILQEMLTVKSDDVPGRSKLFESLVKGENTPEPGIPEAFSVLVRELQGLGLEVKVMHDGEFARSEEVK